MGNTTGKLAEAKFFLDQLEVNYFEYPAGNFYLSAFISSARSVLWVMRNEYSRVDEWKSWYESIEPTSEEAVILKKINDVRIRSEKRQPLKTTGRLTLYIPAEYLTEEIALAMLESVDQNFEITVAPHDDDLIDDAVFNDGLIKFTGYIEDIARVLEDFPDNDALEPCKKYYILLERLVYECEERFGIK